MPSEIFFVTLLIFLIVSFSRRVGESSIIGIGFLFYLLPLFYGVDLFGDILDYRIYYCFSAVLAFILVYYMLAPQSSVLAPVVDNKLNHSIGWFFGIFSLLVIFYIILKGGFLALFLPKKENEIGGFELIVWRNLGSLALVFGVVARHRACLIMGAISLTVTFLSNDRTGPVTAVLAAVVLHFWGMSPVEIIKKERKLIAILSFFAVVMIVGKFIHGYINALALGAVSNSAPEFDVTHSLESFATQAIFNRILHSNFEIATSYVQCFPFLIFPSFGYCSADSDIFNKIIQFQLFPDVAYGIAYNFWAEGYAVAGWYGLLSWLGVYILGVFFLIRMIRSESALLRAMGGLMLSYWVFYIHRNSLFSIVSYEKQILFFGFLAYFGAMFFNKVFLNGRR